ncbi:hypothetical protein [Cryobacterium arcticum]|uniref:Uncharacterized protein n=1 Tax=Cryobacterium arcticum TaxID=670052 RepID=A0A317ZPT2_9MICO|nr:hypothetical protein [Cryobacterium arcticum]PXA67129.1 hypothetical protein CTB96_10205 [Cryobacterium arcticum]
MLLWLRYQGQEPNEETAQQNQGADHGEAREHAAPYLLGAAAQYAATVQNVPSGGDRKAYLELFAAELTRMDSDVIAQETAAALVEHDDREQFLAGVDIFLAGIEAATASGGSEPGEQ